MMPKPSLSRRLKSLGSALGFAALLGACQDLPTAPSAPDTLHLGSTSGLHLAQTTVVCTYGVKQTNSPLWRVRADTLYFPPSELAASGQTVQYRIRTVGPDGLLVYTGDCVVPYTERALRRVDRHFRVRENGGADQFRARQGMITTQGCVQGGVCQLDPVIVQPPPSECATPGCPGYEGDGNNTGPDPGGGSTGGGSDGSPDPTTEEPPLQEGDTVRNACKKDSYNTCITRAVSRNEFDRLKARIDAVRENTHECREAKRILLGMHGKGLEAGRFEFFDGYYKANPNEQIFGYNDEDQYGRIIVYDSYWVWHDPYLVVHEALHTYLHETGLKLSMTRVEQENWISSHQIHCV